MNKPEITLVNVLGLFGSMLRAQSAMNDKLKPGWEAEPIDLPLAIADEALECARHAGYEWWKVGAFNVGQAQLEYIDALHFFLGAVLKRFGAARAIGLAVTNNGVPALLPMPLKIGIVGNEPSKENVIAQARKVAETALAIKDECWSVEEQKFLELAQAMRSLGASLGLDAPAAGSLYFAKNVLNGFRKANGYKEGTYVKIWEHGVEAPMEDNEFVTSCITARLNNGGEPYQSLDDAAAHLMPLLSQGYTEHALGCAT